VLLAGVLAACGGGGYADDATPLPATLGIDAPADIAALGSAVAFSSNATGEFTYQWSFGDGAASTEAAPTHAYARAGVFVVTLTLRNRDGATVTAVASVAVADRAVVQGKVCSGPAESGWCWQQPLPQGNPMRAFQVVDDAVAYAVGQRGQIMKSTDGGATWRGQVSGTTGELGPVAFVNAQVGWVAGALGEVLKTADGGAIWERLSTGRSEPVAAIGAVDASRAWIVTSFGTVLVTRDGGRKWTVLQTPPSSARVVGLSDTDFWVLPYPFSGVAPAALHTTDGGESYDYVPLPSLPAGFAQDGLDLQLVDARHALFVRTESGIDAGAWAYRRRAFLSADGGASWQPLAPPMGDDSAGGYVLVAPATVYWTRPYANPARSTDGGACWQTITLPNTASSVYDPQLRAVGAGRLVVSDYAGISHVSADGGSTWQPSNAGGPGNSAFINSVWFFDSREGVAWSDDGSSARTTDGGQTWSVAAPASFGPGWRRGQFLADGSLGWIVSDSGAIYRSTDKGRSWFAPAPQTAAPMWGVQDLHFVDPLHGWAISPFGSTPGSALWISADGGLTWQAPPAPGLADGFVAVRFADATHGVAVGPPGLAAVTRDGGLTWTARPTGAYNLYRVAFADANTVVAVGESGTIVRSTDGGQSWSVVVGPTFNTLYDVRFVSSTVGHALGDAGVVLVTRDAGATWSRQESGTTLALRGVFFLDEMTGWAIGQSGAILATATGGRPLSPR
jgi:photosystem II stability/assembly factor-like uncharacterized protein